MRALLIALVLALTTAVPAFAGDGGGNYRDPSTAIDAVYVGAAETSTP
jgi:hypothetical protein